MLATSEGRHDDARLWTEYGTEALIALGGGVLTALIMRIKAWQQGLVDEEAALLRQSVAYVLAYAAALGRRPPLRGDVALCGHRGRDIAGVWR